MGKRDKDMENDAELWARIARTAAPLKKDRVPPAVPTVKPPARNAVKATPKPAPSAPPKAPPKRASAPKDGALDRTTARKLDKGKLAVEARLDLHGLRAAEAHAALRRFLKSAQGKGYRHVLVITGKGAPPSEAKSFYAEDERGVLRVSVPHWLGLPDLAPLVVSFAEAPRRLGGEGALYVRIRKGPR